MDIAGSRLVETSPLPEIWRKFYKYINEHTGYLSLGGLPRNSVDRITDRPDMTSVVDRGRKASTQTNKQTLTNMQNRSLRWPVV